MATISINDFGTDQHGFAVDKEKGPKDQDVEFAFRFCMALKKKLGVISDHMVREFQVSFYKYPFGGLLMKLKIGLSEPDTCIVKIRQSIQYHIDLPKKKQNTMTKLLKETECQ